MMRDMTRTSCMQDDVERLQGSLVIEHTLARVGAEKLWKLMREEPFVPALGALTGNQAMQQIRAGLKAVYCSGWQVMPVLPLVHIQIVLECSSCTCEIFPQQLT